MSIRSRVLALWRAGGVDEAPWELVLWTGRNEGQCREQAEEARRRGWNLRVVRIGRSDQADTVEEAEVLISMHRATREWTPLTVYRRGTGAKEVLGEWQPGLPPWLEDDDPAS